ncbi:MAG: hypothetical protein OXP28_09455 [Gammaproteobacteria bacterium]|nr:hypothetical protein [Gammaproteobacteria bacterium]MDE0450152.1 hypothetical protein [Gammaproteobacteria bacterium]
MKDVAGLYLGRYAEPEARSAAFATRTYRHVISIPAFDEPHDFLQRVLHHGVSDVLVIVVANVPDHVSRDDAAFARTRRLLELEGPFDRARNVDVVVVDRVNAPVPRRQGVGLARKIGADIALRLIVEREIETPVIFVTDADAALPPGYFEAAGGEAAGWVYPFVHTSADGDLSRRALMYELSLRYYVNRLEYAGSPYAFHTVGSCLAVDSTSYAMVRGFPRRNAAEDFYLLNKLAKVGRIRRLSTPVIEVEARASTRVPFGTGPALARIPGDPTAVPGYAPETFEALRAFHASVAAGTTPGQPVPELLDAIGYQPGRDPRATHTWFDAFRTLKFVHAARNAFPDVPLLKTLKTLYPGSRNPADLNASLRADEARLTDPKGLG